MKPHDDVGRNFGGFEPPLGAGFHPLTRPVGILGQEQEDQGFQLHERRRVGSARQTASEAPLAIAFTLILSRSCSASTVVPTSLTRVLGSPAGGPARRPP